MRIAVTEWLFTTLHKVSVQNPSQPSMLGAIGKDGRLMAERDKLLLRLYEDNRSEGYLKKSVSAGRYYWRNDGVSETARKEGKLVARRNQSVTVTKTELISSYTEPKTLVRCRVETVAESGPTRFVTMCRVMCVNRPILKWSTQETSNWNILVSTSVETRPDTVNEDPRMLLSLMTRSA